MAKRGLNSIFQRIEGLEKEIVQHVPVDTKALQFRADLAGLLVVAIAASYESCIKETLITYAAQLHDEFGAYTANQYSRLNSRINISDLYGYARTFGGPIHKKFGENINTRKKKLEIRTGKDFTKAYAQILSWRHDFAHAGVRNTTVEEAMATHLFGKRVLYAFDDAFR